MILSKNNNMYRKYIIIITNTETNINLFKRDIFKNVYTKLFIIYIYNN